MRCGRERAPDEQLPGLLPLGGRPALDPLQHETLLAGVDHQRERPHLARGRPVLGVLEQFDQHLLPALVHLGDRPAHLELDDGDGGQIEVQAREPLVSVEQAIDGGELAGSPSTVVDVSAIDSGGDWTILRQGGMGAVEVEERMSRIRGSG